jgi:hypothetical protein
VRFIGPADVVQLFRAVLRAAEGLRVLVVDPELAVVGSLTLTST